LVVGEPLWYLWQSPWQSKFVGFTGFFENRPSFNIAMNCPWIKSIIGNIKNKKGKGMRNIILFALFYLSLPTGMPAESVKFPLKISENRRYFVDQNGKPFLYHADTGWQIYVKLTTTEARDYLIHRKNQGFNTIQTQIAMDPAVVNQYGAPIFDNNNDFSKPNKNYYDHVAEIIAIADSLNLLITMSQPWLGCCEEGFGNRPDKPIQANGPGKNHWYGRWLGKQFAGFNNLFWIIGGDNDHRGDRQPWWTVLCGDTGHAYGSRMWYFPDIWREIIEYPGSYQLKHVIDFFDKIVWWSLVPYQRHKLVVAGYGQFMKPNYVTAALSLDRTLAVAYLPERTTLVVDFGQMAGSQVKAQWYDPINGEYSDAGQFFTDRLEQQIGHLFHDSVFICHYFTPLYKHGLIKK
jgi:hypothetical protein